MGEHSVGAGVSTDGRVKLLIVDDEPDLEVILRYAFRGQVQERGWQLLFAANGEKALRVVREHGDIDAVLTDINMPVMDGLTLLRELDTLNGDMKAVVISAYGDMDNIRTAMQLGAVDFIIKPIDLADLVATVNKTLAVTQRLKAARRNETLKVQAEAASEAKSRFVAGVGTMCADATRVRQCLINLVGNACKFTKQGTITLEASALAKDGVDFVRFRGSDTGIGMTEEQLGRIFQCFEQADTSISRDYGGTGLGLAITAQLCSLMGGGITVTSSPGEGSVFTIELPVGGLPAASEPVTAASARTTSS